MYGPDSPLRLGNPDTVFGILPTGTFNNFASFLRIPRDLERAWRSAHAAPLRFVDLGWVDGLIFTESIGVGMDVEAWKAFSEKPSVWRRILDGAVAVVRALYHYRPRRLRIEVDGEAREVSVFDLTVANCERFSAAFSIAPHAVMDNGKLDVCILPARSKLAFLTSLPLIFFGKAADGPLGSSGVREVGHKSVWHSLRLGPEEPCKQASSSPLASTTIPGAVWAVPEGGGHGSASFSGRGRPHRPDHGGRVGASPDSLPDCRQGRYWPAGRSRAFPGPSLADFFRLEYAQLSKTGLRQDGNSWLPVFLVQSIDFGSFS